METAYGFYLYTVGKSFGSSPYFPDRNDFPLTGFSSLYAVDIATAQAIVAEGTTRGFKGVVWSKHLKIDVDNYETAKRAKRRLIDLGLGFIEYDSGGKGHHFYIEREHAPSHLLPGKDKAWVKANIPEADTSIYTHLHLFRLPGTKHETTGNYKKIVDSHQGTMLSLPKGGSEVVDVQTLGNNHSVSSIFSCFRVMSNSVPAKPGKRHESLCKLTYALRDDAKVSEAVALFWALEVNKLYAEPKSYEEVEKIVGTIYRS